MCGCVCTSTFKNQNIYLFLSMPGELRFGPVQRLRKSLRCGYYEALAARPRTLHHSLHPTSNTRQGINTLYRAICKMVRIHTEVVYRHTILHGVYTRSKRAVRLARNRRRRRRDGGGVVVGGGIVEGEPFSRK